MCKEGAREGERRWRRWEKVGFNMRKAWSHWESETERKRLNQESRCGGERGGEGEWEMMDEIRDSRRRDWEGRRTRSFWERKDSAECVTRQIKAATFWLWFTL